MSFELIEDVDKEKKKVERVINKYAVDPEQHYGYFKAHHTEEEPAVFLWNGDCGITTTYHEATKSWVLVGTPIAPKDYQVDFLHEALKWLKKNDMFGDMIAEYETMQRRSAYKKYADDFILRRPSCTLYWPIYDMNSWTGDTLKGKDWKKMRNHKNRFTKNHKVRVVDSVTVPKEQLKDIIERWVSYRSQTGFGINRKDSNRTDYDHYTNMVDLEFLDFDNAKTVMVDNKPMSITAGWKIPNSETYYSAVGIYDFSMPDLGEYVNWSDLVLLKKQGHKLVDFGGSPKPLLQFKRKFKPVSQYTTYIFTISNKD